MGSKAGSKAGKKAKGKKGAPVKEPGPKKPARRARRN